MSKLVGGRHVSPPSKLPGGFPLPPINGSYVGYYCGTLSRQNIVCIYTCDLLTGVVLLLCLACCLQILSIIVNNRSRINFSGISGHVSNISNTI